ncbi:MAG: hypothetical protein PPFGHCPK_00591 [Spiroplasma endosymbiont of Drosophila atripex]|nr:MAG: hypothetical protein PPFGHCPK_00591 [Spiroplasma endosymbiont of Drosophila atripex]
MDIQNINLIKAAKSGDLQVIKKKLKMVAMLIIYAMI